MLEWGRKLAGHIRESGARPALSMVWPAEDRLAYFDDCRTSYEMTAEAVDGMMIPPGTAGILPAFEDIGSKARPCFRSGDEAGVPPIVPDKAGKMPALPGKTPPA